MSTINITNARKDLYNLVENVSVYHEPALIVGKKGNAVLISEDDWNAIQETLYLDSIPGMTKSIFRRYGTMVMYKVFFTKQAVKDLEKLKQAGISSKAKLLVDIIKNAPYQTPPRYEKLVGNLDGIISRRINIQHRLVYQVYEDEFTEDDIKYQGTIKIIRMWTHYDNVR